jgi:hypothetical protein
MEEIVNALKGKPVLTVGDFDASSRPGLMIRLAIEKGKIKLKVNQEAARAAGLILSSKLLRSAEVVAPGKK